LAPAKMYMPCFRFISLIFAYQFKYFNWCEICVIASFIVHLEFLFELCLSGGFTIACMSDFLLIYIGHKSFKASIRPKSFTCSITFPTPNPTYPSWLITKSSRFICSTSCNWRRPCMDFGKVQEPFGSTSLKSS
jgi:hypothetical protein